MPATLGVGRHPRDQSEDVTCAGGELKRRRRRPSAAIGLMRGAGRSTALSAAAVALLGAAAYAEATGTFCGVSDEATEEWATSAWTTRGCEQSCAVDGDVVCAYHVDGEEPESLLRGGGCDREDTGSSLFCVDYDACRVECLPVVPRSNEQAATNWTFQFDKSRAHYLGEIAVPDRVTSMVFDGGSAEPDKATLIQVVFQEGLGSAAYLSSMVFIGLDLTAAGLPTLPTTLTHLHIENCVLDAFPMDLVRRLPSLETLAMAGNRLLSRNGESSSSIVSISEEELFELVPRLNGDSQVVFSGAACSDGELATVGGLPLCVRTSKTSPMAVSRMLADASSSDSGSSAGSDASGSDGSSGSSSSETASEHSIYLLASLAVPFAYFLYKVGLYIYFMTTYKRYRRSSVDQPMRVEQDEFDTTRPTAEGSSGSLPMTPTGAKSSPVPQVPASGGGGADKQTLTTANFWVDEELQSWRLDFRHFTLMNALTLSANQKRQTLRKASVTTMLHPREIWRASYAVEGSPDKKRDVVLKFVPPSNSHDQLSPTSGRGAHSGSLDKLRAELKRQAVLSHPNVATFIGVAWSPQTHLVAVTEYLAQGDLRQWLHRTAGESAGEWPMLKVQMLVDLARALVYLHSMQPPTTHGNCNSRNVLLSDSLRAKFSDFGNSTGDMLSERDRMAYSAVGSGRWISPEALLGRETTAFALDAGDVYSFGILMAEVDSHELPFSDLMSANKSALPEPDILQLIAKGALSPTLSPGCPPAIAKLVAACTQYQPKQRPSSKQVLQQLQRALQQCKDSKQSIRASGAKKDAASSFV